MIASPTLSCLENFVPCPMIVVDEEFILPVPILGVGGASAASDDGLEDWSCEEEEEEEEEGGDVNEEDNEEACFVLLFFFFFSVGASFLNVKRERPMLVVAAIETKGNRSEGGIEEGMD
jgi:hypothetical protein